MGFQWPSEGRAYLFVIHVLIHQTLPRGCYVRGERIQKQFGSYKKETRLEYKEAFSMAPLKFTMAVIMAMLAERLIQRMSVKKSLSEQLGGRCTAALG